MANHITSSAAGYKFCSHFHVGMRERMYGVYTVPPRLQRARTKISGRCESGFTMHFHHRDLVVGTVSMAWNGQMKD
jgi:hypothetical protein